MSTSLLHERSERTGQELHVAREDIRFHDLAPGRVQIAVVVQNRGARRSPPTTMRIDAAPLGAFVEWQPLTAVAVPAIPAGGSREVRTEARYDRSPTKRAALLARGRAPRPVLPRNLLTDLGLGSTHWAGNLNVFIGAHVVERHMAMAIRILPERRNLAAFCVGTQPDEYSFTFDPDFDARDWECELMPLGSPFDLSRVFARGIDTKTRVEEGRWIHLRGRSYVFLQILPTKGCRTGKVDVRVDQQSTGRQAVVEFTFDPAAAGPGCYVV